MENCSGQSMIAASFSSARTAKRFPHRGARQQSRKFDKPFRDALESLPRSIAMSHQIHTYTELRQQIHDDLRIQHPEWVEPDGGSPVCDFYEARLMELLDTDAKGLN